MFFRFNKPIVMKKSDEVFPTAASIYAPIARS